MDNKSALLERLEERAKQRPGEMKKFPIKGLKRKGEQVIGEGELVWIQAVFAYEFDMATSKASLYFKGLRTDDTAVLEEAIACELLVESYRDSADHSAKLFTSANDIRHNMTKDEIAMLVHQMNLVNWRLAPQEIIDSKETALVIAQELAAKGDTSLIELYNADELMRLSIELAREIERLKTEIGSLKDNDTLKHE